MKTILWKVDLQDDFMNPQGRLPVNGARAIEPNLEQITMEAREGKIQQVLTGDLHNEDSKEVSDTPDYITTFPPHSMRGTPGAEYIAAVRPIEPVVVDWMDKGVNLEKVANADEIVLYKDKFDIFEGNPYADAVLKALNPGRAIVCGVATDYCVDYAVRGLLKRGVEVYVVEDAIKEIRDASAAIEGWKRLGAKMMYTKEVKELLK